ncbi:uncharacterized protein [Porites lutea]|uniref:uncharacterized protein n=1 Tax=Porites lutea TaxID=51062 RepID=UPI003CC69ED2
MKATLIIFAVFFVVVDQFALLNAGSCTVYPPPTNGTLLCSYIGSDPTCQVQCKPGYDFEFTPPLLYFCSGGKWLMFPPGPYHSKLPWPNCTKKID